MKLLTLKSKSGARHRRKRVGRGNGSGMGTFSCRGMNGQNARSGGNRRPGFEGGQTSFISRMPKLKGFKNPNRVPFQAVNVKDLEVFDAGASVDNKALYEKGLVAKKNLPVKILGDGDLSKKLTVKVDSISKSAEDKIKKAGGTCELNSKKPQAPKKGRAAREEAAGASKTSSMEQSEAETPKAKKPAKEEAPKSEEKEEPTAQESK